VGLRARLGCFLLIGGLAVFLLFAVPLWQAIRDQPDTVPAEWLGVALAAAGAAWIGWRLFVRGSAAASRKPPSLGARMYSRWRSGGETPEEPPSADDR
jgi:hypothetical protein